MNTYISVSSWDFGFFNANTFDTFGSSGHVQNYLTNATAQIDENIVILEANLIDHLLNKVERRLSVNFWGEWLVSFVELLWISNGMVVTHPDDVVQQFSRWPFTILNGCSSILDKGRR